MKVKAVFPFLSWLTVYPARNLKWDLLAGITLAFFVLPESMAYSTLAGLPPQTGIYCYLFAGIVYFFFGTSRQLAIGPTSAISMVIGGSIGLLSGGDVVKATMIASTIAIMTGVLFAIAWLVRLNTLANFISDTILVGFKAGAALVIASTQIPKLLGLHAGGSNFFERIWFMLAHSGDIKPEIMVFGICALAVLFLGDHLFPGKPVSLVVVVASIVLVLFTPLRSFNIPSIGPLPHGWQAPPFPDVSFGNVRELLDLAMACFLMAYIETISSARTLARKNGYEIDERQELLALGFVNLSVAAGGGYPVAGGLSQSSVNDQSGAKSPLALIVTSLVLLICILYLTDLVKSLPEVILPVIVLHAVAGLINVKEIRHLLRVSRYESLIMWLSVLAVLSFGILNGLLISVILSIIFLLRISSTPHIAILGRVAGSPRFTDMLRHPENKPVEGLLILRVEGSILYYNAPYIRQHVRSLITGYSGNLQMVIFELSSSTYLDVAGARYLCDLEPELTRQKIVFSVVEAVGSVRDILRAEGLEKEIGHISRKVSLEEVVNAFCGK